MKKFISIILVVFSLCSLMTVVEAVDFETSKVAFSTSITNQQAFSLEIFTGSRVSVL